MIIKDHIELTRVVESAGVELRRQGSRHVALCPFHDEKTPSFFIFNDRRFKCFGCGEHGDVIDFVQKHYGISFQGALKHLGIEQGHITSEIQTKIERRKRRAELINQFKKWCGDYGAWLGAMINRTQKLTKGITPEDLDLYAPLLHELPLWEHHSDILLNGNDREKYQLYKEARKNGKF
jgi:hypothetical protein